MLVKRTGELADFDVERVKNAITKAVRSTNADVSQELIEQISIAVAAVANQEVWTFTPTNIISTVGTSNLVAMTNTVGNTYGVYFKFRLVVF